MNQSEPVRELSPLEKEVLSILVSVEFPGKEQLAEAVHNSQVRTIDNNGSLEFIEAPPIVTKNVKPVPVEAEAIDDDGIAINILLHVKHNRPVELEIFKKDGSSILNNQSLLRAKPFFLPPYPSNAT